MNLPKLDDARVRWCVEHDAGAWPDGNGKMCNVATQIIRDDGWPMRCRFALMRLVPEESTPEAAA